MQLGKLRNFDYKNHSEFFAITVTDNFNCVRGEKFWTIISTELPFTALNSLHFVAHSSVMVIHTLNVFPVLHSLLS